MTLIVRVEDHFAPLYYFVSWLFHYSAAWYLRKKYAGCHAEDTDELLSGKGFIQKEHAAESAKDHFQT